MLRCDHVCIPPLRGSRLIRQFSPQDVDEKNEEEEARFGGRGTGLEALWVVRLSGERQGEDGYIQKSGQSRNLLTCEVIAPMNDLKEYGHMAPLRGLIKLILPGPKSSLIFV